MQLLSSSLHRTSRSDFLAQLVLFGLDKDWELLSNVGINSLNDLCNLRNLKSLGLPSRVETRLAQLFDQMLSIKSMQQVWMLISSYVLLMECFQDDGQISHDKNPRSPSFDEEDPNVYSDYQQPRANQALLSSMNYPNSDKQEKESKNYESDMVLICNSV